ncbi:signal peptidase I [Pigmentibacter sp. JX0631]|uniref:signal peptidase I n=1 Tax=Pigmentibacter sp. JX0631 TaxID=2976982 RepID=UPI0024697B7C|nr:signal peptidase I [Pigmentibacter sp. JX0631]WGL59471.1 signal peptidase I [Pigmentibacter sp. JX0631]
MFKRYFNDFFWVVIFVLCFVLLKTSVLSFYMIPSSSMLPNITPGDRVFLNKLKYALWLPFQSKPILKWSSPKRGEIILFIPPNEKDIFIKRVIGIPGDKISFDKGMITINDHQLSFSYIGNNPTTVYQNSLILEENKDLQLSPHLILMSETPSHTYFEKRNFIVPPNKVFVLGDNRDSSIDSRIFGFIDEDAILGETGFVLFSTTGNDRFFPEFKTERFFKAID